MNIFRYLLGMTAAFGLMIILLITSVEAVAYWSPGYYEKEYTKYQVLESLPDMTMEDLLDVTCQMMDYLRGDREDLHVWTTMGGEHREFFTEREIAHMADVRGLFLSAISLRRICIAIAAASIAAMLLLKTDMRRVLPRSLCAGTGLFFGVCALLGAVIATDFSKYFVIFHHIFFTNDLWILDPSEDMLINIVPEPFFMDTALRIGVTFAGCVFLVFFICLAFIVAERKKIRKF